MLLIWSWIIVMQSLDTAHNGVGAAQSPSPLAVLTAIGAALGVVISMMILLGYHRNFVSRETKMAQDIDGLGRKADANELTLGAHEVQLDQLESRMMRFEAEKDSIIKQAAAMQESLGSIQAEQKFILQQMSKDKLEILVQLASIQSDIRNINHRS